MTMEDAQTRENLIIQVQQHHADLLAEATVKLNETINTGWNQYELVRGNAQTLYANDLKELDKNLENWIAAVEVEAAKVVDPPPAGPNRREEPPERRRPQRPIRRPPAFDPAASPLPRRSRPRPPLAEFPSSYPIL